MTEIKCSFCGKVLEELCERMDAWCASCPNQTCYSIVCEQKHVHACDAGKK